MKNSKNMLKPKWIINFCILLVLCFWTNSVFGQGKTFKKALAIQLVDSNLNNTKLYIYNEPFKAKKTYTTKDQAKNKTPEELFQSKQSVTNQEWVNYNTYGGAEIARLKQPDFFEQNKLKNPDSNYYALHALLFFTHSGKQYAYVKSKLHLEQYPNRSFASCLLIILENGRWYHCHNGNIDARLGFFLANVKTEVLSQLFQRKKKGIAVQDELLSKITTENGSGIDLQLLVDEYYNWRRNPESEQYKHFLEPLNW